MNEHVKYWVIMLVGAAWLAVAIGWAYAWRLDDERDNPGWRADAMRVLAADWRSLSEASMVRAAAPSGSLEDWPAGIRASTWQGLRADVDGADAEESIRHEVAMTAWQQLMEGAEVWITPAIPGDWQASTCPDGVRAVRIWVFRQGEWIDVEAWAREAWYVREAVNTNESAWT